MSNGQRDPRVDYFIDLEEVDQPYDPELEAIYRTAQVCKAALEHLPKPNLIHGKHTVFKDSRQQQHSGLQLAGAPHMPLHTQVALKLPLVSHIDRRMYDLEPILAIRNLIPGQATAEFVFIETTPALNLWGISSQWVTTQILGLLEQSLSKAPQSAVDQFRDHLIRNPQLLNPEIAVIMIA